MPFRFADSEKPATIFPVAGQIQPRLSSSISGTRPDSLLGGEASVVELPDVDSVDLRAYLRPQAANLDHRYVLLSWSQRTQQNRLT